MKKEDKGAGQKLSPDVVASMVRQASAECLAPPEVALKAQTVGEAKAKFDTLRTILLGILAGVFIGLGAMLCTLVVTNIDIGFGLTKLVGGLVFCLGLILVVVAGAELFTGNCLLVMSWFGGKIGLGRVLRNWGLVYFSNLAGSIGLAALMFYTFQWGFSDNGVGASAVSIANTKVNLSFGEALARGILCNFLVCLAIWLCFSARTVTDKIFAIIFPITAFVAAGFEHSVANMYFIPMGIMLADEPSVLEAAGLTAAGVGHLNVAGFVGNLVPVTIGNIIGGSIFVGAVYWASYLRQDRAELWESIKRWLKTLVPPFRAPETTAAVDIAIEEAVELAGGSKELREAIARAVLEKHAATSGKTPLETTGSKGLRELLARAMLAKAGGDETFFKQLAQNPDEVLKGYELEPEERAALSSGDIGWLESGVNAVEDPLGAWAALRLASSRRQK